MPLIGIISMLLINFLSIYNLPLAWNCPMCSAGLSAYSEKWGLSKRKKISSERY